ncbi:MAG: bifunctional demethylmenaquinone methyltransferase/2-methoxy-6-polyprenyl-1,4-benzoquinol methylase UbiE [Paludibacteraceae bacterium]|nr:bifunctional demethylmenaquinone methyltransferase/2-methoxy-6-polyprenyl-1,4-benzoquinol methylase UbiE [Paludibacteraceae bacterium]
MSDIKVEKVLPYESKGNNKTEQVEEMFDKIAGQYDTMNHLMSLFQDRNWRRSALRSLIDLRPKRMLDIATGTADFAISAYEELEPTEIVGIDLSKEMLEVGKKKIEVKGLDKIISLEQGDSMSLRFDDNAFDALTVAFGVRNFSDLKKGLCEMNRVLRPGGRALILELSEPTNPLFKLGYKFYTKCIIPLMAKVVAKDLRAYEYLPESIAACPQGQEMASLMLECGFSSVSVCTFMFGACSLYGGVK